MAERFALVIAGLESIESLQDLPQDIIKSARIAVNYAATRGRTAMAKEVLRQIDFPDDYVAPRNKRLYVREKATNSTLEAIIEARARPTSLSRFLVGSYQPGYQPEGVRVRIGRGGAVRSIGGRRGDGGQGTKAFVFKLNAGKGFTDSKFNLGLAVRTSNGLKPPTAWKPVPLGPNLWLLYGPSVSQALLAATEKTGVAVTLTPEIQDMMSEEFYRQMGLS